MQKAAMQVKPMFLNFRYGRERMPTLPIPQFCRQQPARQIPVSREKSCGDGRVLILTTKDPAALQGGCGNCAPGKPVLNAADGENYAVVAEIAKNTILHSRVTGGNLNEIRSAIEETEKPDIKILSFPSCPIRFCEAFAMTVLIRRAALLTETAHLVIRLLWTQAHSRAAILILNPRSALFYLKIRFRHLPFGK